MSGFTGLFSASTGDDPQKINRFFADATLSSPILNLDLIRFRVALSVVLGEPSKKPSNSSERDACRLVSLAGVQFCSQLSDLQPEDYPGFIRHYAISDRVHQEKFEYLKELADDLYEDAITGISATVDSPYSLSPEYHEVRSMKLPIVALKYYSGYLFFRALVTTIRRHLAAGNRHLMKIDIGGKIVYGSKGISVLPWGKRYHYVSYDQLLMLHDIMHSRFLAHLTAVVHKPAHHIHPITDVLEKIFEYQAAGLEAYGNMGYEVIKAIEPITKAYLSEISDVCLIRPSDYVRMICKAEEKEKSLRPAGWSNKNSVTSLLVTVLNSIHDPWTVTQIFGLQKLMGHPLIDPVKGAREAAVHAQEPDSTLLVNALRLRNAFCHLTLQGYLTQHRKWPELIFNDHGTQLYRLCKAGFLELDNYSYDIGEWNGVSWTRIFDFDYVPNYLELMDDKAIAFYRSKMACAWTPEELGFHPGPIPTRRLLLEMLSRKQISAKAVVRRVMQGDIPLDWLIVALYPKEREMKVCPRMFSMLCFEIRLFFVLAEHNLAEGVFRLLPQQTMTNSGLAVLKRFESLTDPIQSETLLRVFIEVDLTRWNLRWRELSIHLIGDDLDQMYGLSGVYTFAHRFFADALIHVRVSGCPPSGLSLGNMYPPESDLLWYDHKGGFEGICQKHWTIATLAMMYLAVVDYGLRFTLTGQGDNQVLVVWRRLAAHEDRQEALDNLYSVLMDRIELEARRVNQIVKPEECLRSTSVVTYSKHVWVNGVYIPTTLKAHSRLFPVSATDMPTVLDNVGAIYSGAIGAAERSEMPLRSWYMANLLAMDYLEYTLRAGDIHGRALSGQQLVTDIRSKYLRGGNYLRALVTLPSILGGLPISSLTAFVYKGGADPLTSEIMSLKILARSRRDSLLYRRMLGQLQDERLFSQDPRILNLIADPYSIPLKKYRAPKEAVRKATLDQILPTIQNEAVNEMINCSLGAYAEYLEAFFQAATPIYPLPLHDIYAESPMGLTEEFKAKFTNTRSIQKIARGSGSDIAGDMMYHDVVALLGIFDRLCKLGKADIYDPVPPAHEISETLRSRWGREILGVTTIHPLDQSISINGVDIYTEYIRVQSVSSCEHLRTTRGPVAPYIGSRTREKRADYGIRLILNHPGAVAIKKLGLIDSQLSGDARVSEVIQSIASFRTGDELEYSHLLEEHVYGGTPAHRYDAIRGRPPAYLAQTPNVSTHIMMSSDTAGKYSGGERDYPIVFQEFYLTGIWLTGLYSMHCPPSLVPSIRISLPSDLTPVLDKKIECPGLGPAPTFPRSENPLIYTPILYYRQTGNLLRSQCLGEADVTAEAVTRLGWHNVTYAYFASYLDNHNRMQSASDIMYNYANQGEELDLLEVQRIGAKSLFMGASLAIAERVRVQSCRLFNRILPKYREYTLAKKLVNSVLSTFLRSLTHPMMANDPFCTSRQFFLGAGKSGQKMLLDRCCSTLLAMTLSILDNPFHGCYTNPRLVTADSSSSNFSRLVATWMVFQVARVGDKIPSHLRSALFIACVNPLWTAETERRGEEMVVAQLILLRMSLDEIGGGASLVISDAVDKALQGKIFRSLRISIPELMRLSRQLPTPNPRITRTITLIGSEQVFPIAISGKVIDPVLIPIFDKGLQPSSVDSRVRIALDITRHLGVRYGYHGISQEYWIPVLAKHNPGGNCLLVGVGAGAVAVASIRTGSQLVVGLDLISAIPQVQQRFNTYLPPEVRAARYDTRFRWSESMWSFGGNWETGEVVTSSLSYDRPALLCIDIDRAGYRPTLALLIPLESTQWSGTVILKTYCTSGELEELFGHLMVMEVRFYLYKTDRFSAPQHRYLIVIEWSSDTRIKYCSASNYLLNPIPEYPRAHPGHYQDATEFILCTISSGFGLPLDAINVRLYSYNLNRLYRDIVGKQRGRLSDEEFQGLKCGVVLLGNLAARPDNEWDEWVARAIREESLEYTVPNTAIRVVQKLDPRVLMILTKFVTRLCMTPDDWTNTYQRIYAILS
jgi:hypothetical protein